MLPEDSALNESIKSKTHIDLSVYATENLRESVDSALNFPSVVTFNMAVLPLLFFAGGLIGAVALVWYFSVTMGLILGLAAFSTIPIMAWFFGMASTATRLVDDGALLFDQSLLVLQKLGADLPNMKQTGSALYKSSPSELLSAITKIVILPAVADSMGRKVPFFGSALARRMSRMMERMVGATSFKPAAAPTDASEYAANIELFAANSRQNIQQISDTARRWVVNPLTNTAWIMLILHIIFFAFMAIPHFL